MLDCDNTGNHFSRKFKCSMWLVSFLLPYLIYQLVRLRLQTEEVQCMILLSWSSFRGFKGCICQKLQRSFHHYVQLELWTHRAAPVWLGGHLGVRVDAFKLGQSLLFDLLQMLLQRQISICEEPEEHIEDTLRALCLFYTCLKSSVILL